ARVLDEPTHGERQAALRSDLDRHLVRGAADAARPHFDLRLHLIQRALEDAERLLLGALADEDEGIVQDALRHAPLPVVHHAVDELRHQQIVVLRIGEYFSTLDFAFAWHGLTPRVVGPARDRSPPPPPPVPYFGRLAPYFDRPCRRSCTPIESSVPRMMW